LREARIADRKIFFDTLFEQIQELHRRGVAHADLKRRDNLLVVDGRLPCLIDFGAAALRKPGFAPVNHYLYRLAKRFDYNAWAKLKYQGRMDELTPEDRAYYDRTGIEIVARAIKRSYLKLKRRIAG
jgi:serine/threonine protein kinase